MEAAFLSALFVTLVVVVSVNNVLVMLSVKVPSPVGGGGNSPSVATNDRGVVAWVFGGSTELLSSIFTVRDMEGST